jgi:hypothetical protein
MKRLEFGRRLYVFTFTHRFLFLPYDPGFDALQFVHEVGHIDDQVADDRKVDERLYPNLLGVIVPKKRRAGEFRRAVHHHAATTAYPHTTRPAITQSPVHLILDVI